MGLLLVSFLSGVLTVLAPCVLPLLPIIVGGAAQDARRRNPFVIAVSLAASIVAFTLLLKFSAAFVSVPQAVWMSVSGGMLIAFGLVSLFPSVWEKISGRFSLQKNADALLDGSAKRSGFAGDVLIGFSLGPVFSSCSPTYFLILATVLPQSVLVGTVYLVVYSVGLSAALLAISLAGQRLIRRVRFLADPNGWFKKAIGALFVVVGLVIATGSVVPVEVWLANHGYPTVTGLERSLLERSPPASSVSLGRYHEIASPSGFVNSDPITIGPLIGKKVVLIDFMTYSCINCIRTFPYLVGWDKKYRDQGLEIIGIHTPEFSFEKDIDNVRDAMRRFGITFPVVLDNDYGTWNAYGNKFWPRKYLIDLQGNIAYDHVGEGGDAETEAKIRELLGLDTDVLSMPEPFFASGPTSPETYFGSGRNAFLANGKKGVSGLQTFVPNTSVPSGALVLGGAWNIRSDAAVSTASDDLVRYRFQAKQVYLVASATTPTAIGVSVDGIARDSVVISGDRLYTLLGAETGVGDHLLELTIPAEGVSLYTFTFGAD